MYIHNYSFLLYYRIVSYRVLRAFAWLICRIVVVPNDRRGSLLSSLSSFSWMWSSRPWCCAVVVVVVVFLLLLYVSTIIVIINITMVLLLVLFPPSSLIVTCLHNGIYYYYHLSYRMIVKSILHFINPSRQRPSYRMVVKSKLQNSILSMSTLTPTPTLIVQSVVLLFLFR